MLSRSSFLMLLGGAVGVPYLCSSAANLGKQAASEKTANAPPGAVESEHPSSAADRRALSAFDSPSWALDEVLRFDVTPAWVLGHWPRVSAGLAEVDLQGYRVPLVTGGMSDDLAGSLTYYFNEREQVRRITFFGTTGDGRRLVALLATRFGLAREADVDPGVFLYRARDGRTVLSELRIKPARVVRADEPNARFDVALVLQRGDD